MVVQKKIGRERERERERVSALPGGEELEKLGESAGEESGEERKVGGDHGRLRSDSRSRICGCHHFVHFQPKKKKKNTERNRERQRQRQNNYRWMKM